jgi:hypothetical protein
MVGRRLQENDHSYEEATPVANATRQRTPSTQGEARDWCVRHT